MVLDVLRWACLCTRDSQSVSLSARIYLRNLIKCSVHVACGRGSVGPRVVYFRLCVDVMFFFYNGPYGGVTLPQLIAAVCCKG